MTEKRIEVGMERAHQWIEDTEKMTYQCFEDEEQMTNECMH